MIEEKEVGRRRNQFLDQFDPGKSLPCHFSVISTAKALTLFIDVSTPLHYRCLGLPFVLCQLPPGIDLSRFKKDKKSGADFGSLPPRD